MYAIRSYYDKLQFGAEGRFYDIYNHNRDLVNLTDGQVDSLLNPIFTPGYPNLGTITDQGENIEYSRRNNFVQHTLYEVIRPIIAFWYWCTDQYIIQRLLSAKGLNDARRGSLLAAGLKILPIFILVLPGLIAAALYPEVSGDDAFV